MSNVTVQEALISAIELIQCFEAKLTNSQTAHSLPSEKVKRKLRNAISDIEKCEPVGEVVIVHEPEWMKPREGFKWYQTEFPLGTKFYTSPQPIKKCEPVAYNHHFIYDDDFMPELVLSHSKEIPAVSGMKYAGKTDELYDKPQPREWVGLSDDDINELQLSCLARSRKDLVKQADEKLKQLNTKG